MFNLKKLLDGAVADINLWDGGKSHGNMSGAPRPASTAKPSGDKRNIVQRGFDAVNPFDNGKSWDNAQPTTKKALWQQALDNPVINPISAVDDFKIPGLGVSTAQIAEQVPEVTRGMGRTVEPFVAPVIKTAKTLNAGREGLNDLGLALGAKLSGNEDAYAAASDKLNRNLEANTKGSWIEGGRDNRFITSDPNKRASTAEFGAEIANAGIQTAPYFMPGTQAFSLPARVGIEAGGNYLLGAGGSAAQQYVNDGNVDWNEANQVGGMNALVAGAVPVAGKVLGKAFNKVTTKLAPTVEAVTPAPRPVTTSLVPQPVYNNAPIPSGSGVPIQRSAKELADELAASQARAIDPAVQARRAMFTSKPTQPRVNINPDDQAIIRDLNDYVAGTYQPGTVGARRLETDAAMIAEKYNLPVTRTTEELAEALDGLNASAKNSIFYKKPGKSVNQNAPKPSKQDPLEALKAEARKYKSADEFDKFLFSRKQAGDPVVIKELDNLTKEAQKLVDSGVDLRKATNQVLRNYQDRVTLTPEKYSTLDEFLQAQGKPLYHGTDAKFDRYSLNNFGKTDDGFSGKGVYLSGRKGNAKQYGKNVIDSYVSLKNPFEYEDSYAFGAFSPGGLRRRLGLPENASADAVTAELKRRGHDGIVINENTGKGIRKSEEVVVLDPNQIKTKQQLTDLYNQAVGSKATKPKAYYQNVPKSYTEPKKTAFEQNTGVVAPTRAKGAVQEPKAPILEQATPDEIKISSAAESSKVGAKQRLKDGREQLVNRFAPVEDLVSKIERETGTPLRPSANPLSYVRQYLGGGGIANAKIDDELTPIIKQTKQFDGLREYLVAKRMNELADRGMSKRADDVLEGINKKYGAEIDNFEKIARELYAYQNKQLDELVDVGVLSKQAAENIRAKNQFYVPFNRVIPDLEDFAGTTGGSSIGKNGQPIKAIKGSDKDIIDPIESMIRNTYDIQATVQKQKVMRALRELAPDEFTVPAKASLNKNRVGMFVDGEKVILETSEPLARALNSMAEEQMNMAVRVMSLPAKALRSGATSLNVAFALPNVLRDQLSAAVNSKYGGVPMYDFVSGLASVINKDDSYKKWIMSGADQASFFAQDRTTLQRGVKDITGGAAYKVGKLVKSPLELFRIIGQFSEEGSRVGVYKRALKGATKEFGNLDDATLAAAKESREATIDFARRGSKMKAANALIPFLNARLQGTLKLANSFKERPVQTGAVGMAIAGLPAAALYLHNSQYPEYNEIPDYVRRENFIIMTGNKETPFIKIPKGEVGKIFGNPVESFLAQMSSDDPEWKSTIGTLVDSFLPVGSVEDPGKFVTDLMPTAASVPLQMTANFDTFRGMPIVSQWQKDLPPEQQFSNYNTETGKKIGAALGVSPAMLEFGVGGVTGGLGRQALQIGDMVTGNKVPTQDLPVISRFAGEQKDLSKSANEVYDQLDKDKQATARDNYKLKQAIKNGDLSGIEGLDKTKANRLVRSVKEDEIKKTLNPTEKALWSMSKEDLESYSGKYGKEASKVLELKDSLNTSSSSKASNPKERYQKALDEYNKDKKEGKVSEVNEPTRQKELAKLKIKSNFDEDTVDLYSKSFKDIVAFVNSNKNGKGYWEKIQALDKATVEAGGTSKLYNKNGSLKATASKGGGKKGKKAKKGKYDYSKRLASSQSDFAAIRNLVKRPKYTRKKVSIS